MREIRFRGKCIEDCELKGQWLYGHYLKSASHFIAVDQGLVDGHFKLYQVDPETVGQYTGLKDRNGLEIYEGDVLRLVLVDYADIPEQVFVVGTDSFFEDVCYLRNISRFVEDIDSVTDGIEVIGNRWDNTELLKGEKTA